MNDNAVDLSGRHFTLFTERPNLGALAKDDNLRRNETMFISIA